MPNARKQPGRARKAKSTSELTKELHLLKAEVAVLRERYSTMNRTLLRLCCPEEWFVEEVDDAELWTKAVWEPSLSEVIAGLK